MLNTLERVMKLDPNAFLADAELLDGLRREAKPLSCSEKQVLFRQGDPPTGLYILNSGEAELTMDSPEGAQLMAIPAAPGSLLGLPGLIGSEPYSLTAIALPGAQLSFISRDSFLNLMKTDLVLSLKVLQVLAAEVRSARIALRDR
jgi:CRP/FNR family transcriptional regulator, cyclic AMP receptor protein